jgi:hypothetical protein
MTQLCRCWKFKIVTLRVTVHIYVAYSCESRICDRSHISDDELHAAAGTRNQLRPLTGVRWWLKTNVHTTKPLAHIFDKRKLTYPAWCLLNQSKANIYACQHSDEFNLLSKNEVNKYPQSDNQVRYVILIIRQCYQA